MASVAVMAKVENAGMKENKKPRKFGAVPKVGGISKKASRISHCSTTYPCCGQALGEFSGS